MTASLGPAERKKAGCKRAGEQKSSDGKVATPAIDKAACRSRLVYRNSEQFRLVKQLFNASQPRHLRPATWAERMAIRRLAKAGLIKASLGKKVHDCCGRGHVMYSITLAGRAHFVASELGLTFPQLCYFAYGRNAARNSVIDRMPAFVHKDVDSVFFMVLGGASPMDTRKALTRKGFLVKRAWHASAITPRFAELERYASVLDMLYLWMRNQYEAKLLQAMHDPAIAKVVRLIPQANG